MDIPLEENFIDVIDEISNRAVCGPDGWSVALIKGIKHFPSNLKNGYMVGVYKIGPK